MLRSRRINVSHTCSTAVSTSPQALDILTPLGRGQAQLVTGLPGAGKTLTCLDAILGQVRRLSLSTALV